MDTSPAELAVARNRTGNVQSGFRHIWGSAIYPVSDASPLAVALFAMRLVLVPVLLRDSGLQFPSAFLPGQSVPEIPAVV